MLIVKADLDGTTFAYHCRMRFLERGHCSHAKSRTQLSSFNIACTYDCRRILKHVLKYQHIFCDIHDSCKQVVGLIYTKQFVLETCHKLVTCNKVVPCKSAFRITPMIKSENSQCFVVVVFLFVCLFCFGHFNVLVLILITIMINL